ncbi:MAG: RNA polymerase factor sigma-54, partial [Betaproteobacteria bacterium]|nr:RNA polymerase factor sigma-54 [Betaproteobacteria bacterium]
MKASLQLKLSQHLTLTPQLQQSIRLLQLSTAELNQELEQYLADNPLLERDEPSGYAAEEGAGGAEPLSEHHTSEASPPVSDETTSLVAEADESYSDTLNAGMEMSRTRQHDGGDDDNEFSQIPSAEPGLQQHLLNQVTLLCLSEHDAKLVALLIAHLDDDGYLTCELPELHALFSEHMALEPEELRIALNHLQYLEPTGVGARSLAECLALQIKALDIDESL